MATHDWRAAYEKGLGGLNPWQRAICDRVADVQKPDWIRVVAAAGAGKTATTTVTLARIVNESLLPLGAVFATTFTNKAGGELRERLEKMVPPGTVEKMRVGTFHSLCASWLGKNDPQPPAHHWGQGSNIDGKDSLWKAGVIGDQIIGDVEGAVPGTSRGDRFSDLNVLEMTWTDKRTADGKVRKERKKTFTKDRTGKYVERTNKKPGLGIRTAYKYPPSWGDYAQAIGIFRSRGLTPADVAAAKARAEDDVPPASDLEARADATWKDIVMMGGTEVPPPSDTPKDEPAGLPLLLEAWTLFDEAKQGLGVYDFEDILYAYWRRGTDQAALVFVDEAQDCQPPGTQVLTPSGSVPIESIRPGDRVVSYNMKSLHLSARGSSVSGVTSRPYKGQLVTVACGEHLSRYTAEHHCIVHVGPALEGKHILYLMRRGTSYRVGVTSPKHGKFKGSSGPAGRLLQEGGDALWILATFDDRREAFIEEALISMRYGIPDKCFSIRADLNTRFGQAGLDTFWQRTGPLEASANQCLQAFGRDIRYPLYDRIHAKGRMLLHNRAMCIRASNIMSGMLMIDAPQVLARRGSCEKPLCVNRTDAAWRPIIVGKEDYDGPVYSLSVDTTHTYVADGLVTHNCSWLQLDVSRQLAERAGGRLVIIGDGRQSIFSWRGADPSIFIHANEVLHADTMQIPTNYRSGRDVVEVGNEIAEGQEWAVGMPAIPAREDVRNDGVRIKPVGNVRVRRGSETSAQEVTQTAHDVRGLVLGEALTINGRSSWEPSEIEAAFQTWRDAPETLRAKSADGKDEWTPEVLKGEVRGWSSKRGDAVRISPETVDGQPSGRMSLRLGSTLREIAILCRTNKEAHAYSMALMLPPSVPALVVGTDTTFFDTTAASDVLSMCFLSRKIPLPIGAFGDRPSRESGFSLLGCVSRTWRKAGRFHGKFFPSKKFGERVTELFESNPRGAFSEVVKRALSEIIREQSDRRNPDWDLLERWESDRDEYVTFLSEIEQAAWPQIAKLAADSLLPPALRMGADADVEADVEEDGEDEGGGTSGTEIITLFREIADGYASFQEMLDFAQKLSQKVKAIANPDRDMSVAERREMEEEFKRRVTISTLHRSKGLEWKHVFLSSTDGVFPRPPFGPSAVLTAEGEDQRLFYVGVTRAKDTCTLTCAEMRQKGAKMVPAGPSEFIREYVYPYLRLVEEGLSPWRRVLEDIRSIAPSGYALTSTREDYGSKTHTLRWSAEGRPTVSVIAERGVKDGEPNKILGWHVFSGVGGAAVADRGRDLLPTFENALQVAGRVMSEGAGIEVTPVQRFEDFVVFLRTLPGEARSGLSWAQYADWLVKNQDAVIDEFSAVLQAGGDVTRSVMGWTSLEELWAEASARADNVTVKCDPTDQTQGYAIWRSEFLGVLWRLPSGRIAYRGSLALEKPAGRDLLGYGRLEFTRGCVDNTEWPVSVYTVWPDRPSATYAIRARVPVYVDGSPEFSEALAAYAQSLQPPEGPVCTAPECRPPSAPEGVEAVAPSSSAEAPLPTPPGWSLRWKAPEGSAHRAWWWNRDDWYWLAKPEGGFVGIEITVTLVESPSGGWRVQILPADFYREDIRVSTYEEGAAHVLGLMQKHPVGAPVPGTEGRLFGALPVLDQIRAVQQAERRGEAAPPPVIAPSTVEVVAAPPEPVEPAPEAVFPTGYEPITAASWPTAPPDTHRPKDVPADSLDAVASPVGWPFWKFDPSILGGAWVHPAGAAITATLVLFQNTTPLFEVRRNFRVANEPATVWIAAFYLPTGDIDVVRVAQSWAATFGPDSSPLAASTLATPAPSEEVGAEPPPRSWDRVLIPHPGLIRLFEDKQIEKWEWRDIPFDADSDTLQLEQAIATASRAAAALAAGSPGEALHMMGIDFEPSIREQGEAPREVAARPPVWVTIPLAEPTRGFGAAVINKLTGGAARFATRGYQGWLTIPRSLVRARSIVTYDNESSTGSGTQFTYAEVVENAPPAAGESFGTGVVLPVMKILPRSNLDVEQARIAQIVSRRFATDPLTVMLAERQITPESDLGVFARELYEGSGGRPMRVGGTIWTQAEDLVAIGADTDREGKLADRTIVRRASEGPAMALVAQLVSAGALDDLGDGVYAFPGDSHEVVTEPGKRSSSRR